jgi:hypothetical protein
MNQKTKITEYVMKELGLESSSKNIKIYTKLWWQNIRNKPKGGLWLTELGFEALSKADIKSYQIKFNEPIDILENKFILWLDNSIECPFFLTKKEIHVFGEKTAVQMILFSGDLKMLHKANTKNKEKIVDKTLVSHYNRDS